MTGRTRKSGGFRLSSYNPRLLTISQVADRLNSSESTISRRLRHGQIPVVLLGGNIFVFAEDCPPSMNFLPVSPATVVGDDGVLKYMEKEK